MSARCVQKRSNDFESIPTGLFFLFFFNISLYPLSCRVKKKKKREIRVCKATYPLIWGMSNWLVCLHVSTHPLRNFRIFSLVSGESRAVPMCTSSSRNWATWLLISTTNCEHKHLTVLIGLQTFKCYNIVSFAY